MKLLLDQNLSPRLASLADLHPGSVHVQSVALDTATDDAVWLHARAHGLAILTKDEDFNDIAVIRGFPPKNLWLQLGNCTTSQIEAAIRRHHFAIEAFADDPNIATFVIR